MQVKFCAYYGLAACWAGKNLCMQAQNESMFSCGLCNFSTPFVSFLKGIIGRDLRQKNASYVQGVAAWRSVGRFLVIRRTISKNKLLCISQFSISNGGSDQNSVEAKITSNGNRAEKAKKAKDVDNDDIEFILEKNLYSSWSTISLPDSEANEDLAEPCEIVADSFPTPKYDNSAPASK